MSRIVTSTLILYKTNDIIRFRLISRVSIFRHKRSTNFLIMLCDPQNSATDRRVLFYEETVTIKYFHIRARWFVFLFPILPFFFIMSKRLFKFKGSPFARAAFQLARPLFDLEFRGDFTPEAVVQFINLAHPYMVSPLAMSLSFWFY